MTVIDSPLSPLIKVIPHGEVKIWGGMTLGTYMDTRYPSPGREISNKIGELWCLSDLEEGSCSYKKGDNSHQLLSQRDHEFFPLPYLVKFIETQDKLSIQVHPDDAYASMHEGTSGKDECWIVLKTFSSKAGVYLGLREGVTKSDLSCAIGEGKDLDHFLNFIPVEEGDYFYIPAGSIHAIGEDLLLLEVQRPSGITYRLWDSNRVDHMGRPRSLHIQKAMDVLVERDLTFWESPQWRKKNLFSLNHYQPLCIIQDHVYFSLLLLHLSREKEVTKISLSLKQLRCSSPLGLIVLGGDVLIERGGQQREASLFDSFLIPLEGDDQLLIQTLSQDEAKMVIIYKLQ
jgi:mannose-6-phosphate isomerase